MKAIDVMIRIAIALRPEDSILSAIRLMLDHKVSGLPVINDAGELVGIVTEGDLLRRTELATEKHRSWWREQLAGPGKLAAEYTHAHARHVADLMSSPVRTVTADMPLEQVVETMEHFKIKRLPVMDGNTLVGIISRSDVLRAVLSLVIDPAIAITTATSDQTIKTQLVNEMKLQSWSPTGCIEPRVHDGIVDLCGTIFDERERIALRVMTENISGVSAIRDYLVYIEPMSGMAVGAPGLVQ